MDKTNAQTTQNKDGVIIDPAFEKMIKDFLRQVRKDGVIEEVKRRRYYMKPSEKKRLRKNGKPKRSLQK
jgi:ribosomal protein S21